MGLNKNEPQIKNANAFTQQASDSPQITSCQNVPDVTGMLLESNLPEFNLEEDRKRKFFTILMGLLGVPILFFFGVYHLNHGSIIDGIIDLGAGIWSVVFLFTFPFVKNRLNLYRMNAVLLGALFLFLATSGGIDGNKIMWSFSFPLIAMYTLGKDEGLVLVGTFYIVLIGLLFGHWKFFQVYAYSPVFKIRFCIAFFLIGFLAYIYELIREHSQTRLKDERNKLKAEKEKLAELSSELQKANKALMLSEQRLTRAQAIARVGNLEYDISSGTAWGSEESFRILGIDGMRLEFPMSLLERIIPSFAQFQQELEDCMRKNIEYNREITAHRVSDGKQVVLRARAEVVRNANGRAEKIIGVIQDISDRKEAEREKRELEDRLARSQKMESLGLLAGGVAHDLNNVLSAIVGYPDLLLRNLPPTSQFVSPIQRIKDSGLKAAAIVQDLLTMARRSVTNHQVLNFNDLVAEYMLSQELDDIKKRHTKVSFNTQLDPNLLNIKGSEIHLKKTILNLVSNAVEAQPAGGRVLISTKNISTDGMVKAFGDIPAGDYVMFQVEDNGIGISQEDLGRIFEPFYTKKKMGRSGTGLGMSVVWGTVQDHSGYIHVDSSEGTGTRIELFFPVSLEKIEAKERLIPVEEYVGKGETILVVDDVPEQRDVAQNMLTSLGYKVYTATDGESAISFLADRSIDLVILDMILEPGIDGLDTYIRILESHPGQRAIIFSGFSETDRVRKAQQLGAMIYVQKPYTLEQIGLAVCEALKH